MEITNSEEFLAFFKDNKINEKLRKEYFDKTNLLSKSRVDFVLVDNITLSNIEITVLNFHILHLKNCVFVNCRFWELTATATIFENCRFEGSYIGGGGFNECDLTDVEFIGCRFTFFLSGDCIYKNVSFNHCPELLEVYFGGCEIINMLFDNSVLEFCRFEQILANVVERNVIFKNSTLFKSKFSFTDLSKSTFQNCLLNLNSFNNCMIHNSTIQLNNTVSEKQYSSIDFQSLLNSQNIDGSVLLNCFGINNSAIKNYIEGLTTEVKFQTVFISYSFADKKFAELLNSALIRKGVVTFLWEKDAPYGKNLKKIMRENITNFHRLLFIASENSIKSKACQFELTEGRNKQEKLWEDILFPVHLDDYLFNVNKNEIKPSDKRSQYWKNIVELRDINSANFTLFNKNDFDSEKFEQEVNKLVKTLRKE